MKTTKKKFTFRDYILASVVFHILFALSLFLTAKYQKLFEKEKPVEVALLTEDEMQALKQLQKLEQQPKQIAESSANEMKNDKAKYLSEKNNSVEKETKARIGEQFKNAKQKAAKAAAEQQQQAATKPKPSGQQIFADHFDPYASLMKKEDMKRELKNFAKGTDGAEKGEASATNDNLEGVTEDLITKLNTKEYKYYGFYHRIKIQLNQWWQPKVREKVTRMVRQGRTIASDTNKVTRLVIILNDSGNLVKVQVLGESGVRDLDDAAVEAFRQAAPFPNPPKGIVDSDGTVKIRWDFVIES